MSSGAETGEVQAAVRERYAEIARASGEASCCGPNPEAGCGPGGEAACGSAGDAAHGPGDAAFGAGLYPSQATGEAPGEAVAASLGCGNPTAVADLRPGEVVLDLGSGAGLDVLLSARRVGPKGVAYGLDMTPEMLELARENARRAGVGNAVFLDGTLEDIPLPDASVDVVISNCVINLSGDKPRALREAARVLRPGGRLAVTDIVADPDMPEEVRRDMERWTGCISGALTADQFERHLSEAGLVEVEVRETHRVHESAGSAIVRARRP